MKYGSVCSGIEAASFAWEPLGWEAQWYSEIEQFPSAVLAHRFPSVPNLGDMTKIHETQIFNDSTINLLVGGTPCQSFSVAGLRKGLADPRGNLMLTFLSLAQRKKPRWIVWENVPGVLSSNGGRDFGTFLQALAECGYGFAYRVLDAQYFGVAQRRRRVFVVGYLGDWRPAAAVLFEQDCLSGHSKKSREKRKATSSDAQGGSGGRGQSTGINPDLMATLCAKDNEKWGCNQWVNEGKAIVEPKASWWNGEQTAATLTKQNANGAQRMPDKDNFGEVAQPIAFQSVDYGGDATTNLSLTLRRHDPMAIAHPIAISTKQQSQNISENIANSIGANDYKEPQVVAQPVPFRKAKRAQSKDDHETWEQDEKTNTLNAFDVGDIRTTQAVVQPIAVDVYNQSIDGQTAATITEAVGGSNTSGPKIAQPIAVDTYNQTINEHTTQTIGSSASDVNHYGAVLTPQAIDFRNQSVSNDVTSTLQSKSNGGYSLNYQPGILQPTMAIRRLTPTECERLQGFPDGWTKIPYRNKPEDQCPDGPRYKACGNSMAVPVMRWIGQRIQMVEKLLKEIS